MNEYKPFDVWLKEKGLEQMPRDEGMQGITGFIMSMLLSGLIMAIFGVAGWLLGWYFH